MVICFKKTAKDVHFGNVKIIWKSESNLEKIVQKIIF